MKSSNWSPFRWIRTLRRSEAGSALVEAAITMPVLIMLFVGAVEMGELAFKAIEVANAAKAAAQYATMNGGGYMDTRTSPQNGGVLMAAYNDAPYVVSTCTGFTVTSTPSCSCSDGSGACSGTGGNYSCTTGKPVVTVAIQTQATCPVIAALPGLGNSFTLYGNAKEKVLQ